MHVIGYAYATTLGVFSIRAQGTRWVVLCDDENLGSYHSATAALDDLVGGHTDWPSSGADPSRLGLPDELGEWVPIALR